MRLTLSRQGNERNYFQQEPANSCTARSEVVPFFILEVVMDYRPFYSLICELANEKISRALFVLMWGVRQKEQGL